ncbi:30S ribosomal protein S10 [Candidatus Hodgkinia cicadicola]|uniref:30S ribosomal protein S10 n=1 Tax=Candidatus Hodgkinia cicadicola TaxID=573658 RepID=A0ABX4MIU2_9HYPH|nr:30S ribosomal protein S10 [Candidatus Hodgkinia cicadicola]
MENLILIFRMKPDIIISGIINLPTKIKRFTVNRSPYIDKKNRDQLEIRTYSKFITIIGNLNEIFPNLIKLITPHGINVGINNNWKGYQKNNINSKWN